MGLRTGFFFVVSHSWILVYSVYRVPLIGLMLALLRRFYSQISRVEFPMAHPPLGFNSSVSEHAVSSEFYSLVYSLVYTWTAVMRFLSWIAILTMHTF